MLDNVSRCAADSGSRLVKAKSSPNVSKPPLSSPKKQSQSNQTTNSTVAPSKPSRSPKTPTTSRISIKTSPNDMINPPRRGLDSSKSRLTAPLKIAKQSSSETRPDMKTVSPAVRSNDKKKICKSASSSPSCTILEDRALLKKGLTYTPDKTPAKPEALRRKATLDRSISLSSVSSCNQTNSAPRWIPVPSERRSAEKGKMVESPRKAPTPMNRSTSLWCVQTPRMDNANQCRRPSGASARLNSVSRPSKIPLPAARSTGLGRSLADLSQVDRVGEPLGRIISFELDLDATSERIYENCREALDRASKLASPRISTSMSSLEERAARLMAELEDDVESKEALVSVNVAPSRRTEIVYEDRETANDSKSNVTLKNFIDNKIKKSETDNEEKANKTATVNIFEDKPIKSEENVTTKESAKIYSSNQSCEKSREIADDSKRNKESSIQELRRNWERQTRGVTDQDANSKTIYTANSEKLTVNLSKAARIGNDVIDGTQETKRKQCIGKRAKDIEHLVNFFNCKNAENLTKESPRETLIKPRSVDPVDPMDPIIETPAVKKNEKNANEYSGYVSDGNCSEDSGHMSNENEVEWKDTMENQGQRGASGFKDQQYFDRIHRNDNAKIFDSTIVCRLPEPEKEVAINRDSPLMSSGASSIDSCRDDRCSENGRQVRVEQPPRSLALNTDSTQQLG
ncbi:hypothetical protein DMN91_002750 [Ooceraea biroi]|uniref:Uncharacterized protein n=1 Tax=Ooceraea biroi TaxID=2015173 RepID=A0A3L8DW46_OOCBI|nr:hypothetical protein DMN91_002750 [Ooceraea biroi]